MHACTIIYWENSYLCTVISMYLELFDPILMHHPPRFLIFTSLFPEEKIMSLLQSNIFVFSCLLVFHPDLRICSSGLPESIWSGPSWSVSTGIVSLYSLKKKKKPICLHARLICHSLHIDRCQQKEVSTSYQILKFC